MAASDPPSLEAEGIFINKEAWNEHASDMGITKKRSASSDLLNIDLRKLVTPQLPKEVQSKRSIDLSVPLLVVQVISVLNIAQPSKRQNQKGLMPSLLQVRFADGSQKYTGIVLYSPVTKLNVDTPPGTKLILNGPTIAVRNGKLLLEPNNTRVAGGHVTNLVESWKANRDLKAKQLLNITSDKVDPPPAFEDFSAAKLSQAVEKVAISDKKPDAAVSKKKKKPEKKKPENKKPENKKSKQPSTTDKGKKGGSNKSSVGSKGGKASRAKEPGNMTIIPSTTIGGLNANAKPFAVPGSVAAEVPPPPPAPTSKSKSKKNTENSSKKSSETNAKKTEKRMSSTRGGRGRGRGGGRRGRGRSSSRGK